MGSTDGLRLDSPARHEHHPARSCRQRRDVDVLQGLAHRPWCPLELQSRRERKWKPSGEYLRTEHVGVTKAPPWISVQELVPIQFGAHAQQKRT